MSKVSSNAGKHEYCRPESGHLFAHLNFNGDGIKMSPDLKPVFPKQEVETGYEDQDGDMLFFKDVVQVKDKQYEITYKDCSWVLENQKNPSDVLKLSSFNKKAKLRVKYNKS